MLRFVSREVSEPIANRVRMSLGSLIPALVGTQWVPKEKRPTGKGGRIELTTSLISSY